MEKCIKDPFMSAQPQEIYSPGLEGVIAGETAISTVDGGLRYRGYPVTELAEKCQFDEVAYLLLHNELPDQKQLTDFQKRVAAAQKLPAELSAIFPTLPRDVSPMDALRTAISVLSHFDPDVGDNSTEANLRKAERLYAQIPLCVTEAFHASKRQKPVTAKPGLPVAAQFLYLINGKEASAEEVRAFDASLTLYAEHEFNASTFTARVAVSTLSDLHSGVVGAIGALKGPLHGGANEKVMDLLIAAGGPDTAEKWVRDALARKEKIMGFGHRVYKTGDIRAKVLREYARKAAERTGQMKWEHTADVFEKIMADEKKLLPNLDWPAGRLYHALGLEIPIYTPIFVVSRITGWSAHVIEQLANNRLIRPRARYTGPPERKVVPISARK
jgi:citrate synthase